MSQRKRQNHKCKQAAAAQTPLNPTDHPDAAGKLERIIWALIVSGQPYDESKAFNRTPVSTARRLRASEIRPKP